MKRANTDAYATMTLSTATTAVDRSQTTKITKTSKAEITELDMYMDSSQTSDAHAKGPSAVTIGPDKHVLV